MGNEYLEKILDENKAKSEDLKTTRRLIKELFSELNLFLFPYPGKSVVSKKFTGSVEEIEADFKKAALVAAEHLFDLQSLSILKINDSEVKASELLFYMNNYMKIFQSNTLPEPKTIFLATSEANNLTALIKAKQNYIDNMDQVILF